MKRTIEKEDIEFIRVWANDGNKPKHDANVPNTLTHPRFVERADEDHWRLSEASLVIAEQAEQLSKQEKAARTLVDLQMNYERLIQMDWEILENMVKQRRSLSDIRATLVRLEKLQSKQRVLSLLNTDADYCHEQAERGLIL